MSFIFLDESGDLGLDLSKQRTTRFFIVTIIFAKDKIKIERIIKKVHSKVYRKCKNIRGLLHANSEKLVTKRLLLNLLNKIDIKIMTIYLDKKKVYTNLKRERDILYNFVVNKLLDRIISKNLISIDEEITLVASRKETSKFLNINFKNYLLNQMNNNINIKLKIEIKTPYEAKCLQAVDFVSWSIFRKYEYDDDSYYNIIRERIVDENPIY